MTNALIFLGRLAIPVALAASGCGASLAQSVAEGGEVFSSPPSPVMRGEAATPSFELNVTGRAADAFPRIEGNVSLELQNDWTFRSDDRQNEINDLTTSNDLLLRARIDDAWSIQATFVAEDVKDPVPGSNRALEDNGVFVETLGLLYQTETVSVFAGKFNPTFGIAWDLAPGVYGADLAGDYELVERIGFGGSITYDDDDAGEHTLTAQTFFLDTSPLSQSIGARRGRTSGGDGGVSNTESFRSFSATLDGDIPAGIEDVKYQLGVERQAKGSGDRRNEWGAAIGIYREPDEDDGVQIAPVFEWARIENQGGEPNVVNYLTAGAGFFLGPWNLALSYTGRITQPSDGRSFTDNLAQLSGGYRFPIGVSLNIGYACAEDEHARSHILGVLLVYEFDYAIY